MWDLQGIYRKATSCWLNIHIHLEPVSDWRKNERPCGEISSDEFRRSPVVSSWEGFDPS